MIGLQFTHGPAQPESPVLLLAEDNRDDAELIREALAELGASVTLHRAADGREALDMLQAGLRPDLVLLDLNMPRLGGRETLKAIKADPALRTIPVVILTTSDADQDIRASYHDHCSGYFVKPATIDELIDVLRQVSSFWFSPHARRLTPH